MATTAGGAAAAAQNNTKEFIEQFGKNIHLRPNVKARLFAKAKTPQYAEESTSKYLPIKMVDEAIESQNLPEIVELLVLARFLKNKLLEVGLSDVKDLINQHFLSIETHFPSVQEEKEAYLKNRRRWQWLKYYQTSTVPPPPPEVPGATYYNYSNNGRLVPSKVETLKNTNYPYDFEFRVVPEYEIVGQTGYYNKTREEMEQMLIFQGEDVFNEIRRRQQLLVSFMENHDPQMFETELYIIPLPGIPQMSLILLPEDVIEEITFLRNLHDYLVVTIQRLERAKVQLMNFAVAMRRVDQLAALEKIRSANIQDLADKYDVNLNSMTANLFAGMINSPNRTGEEKEELSAFIQKYNIPKIRYNLNKLRQMKQKASHGAGTRRGGRRRRINKTKRR